MKNQKAFTLIEVLVVATIIGLLAAVGMASYSSLNKNARDARRKADLENVRAAFEQYRSNNSSYPTTYTFPTNCTLGSALTDAASNTYMSNKPVDPKCSTYYYNASSITANDYTIGAYLETPPSPAGSCGNCGSSIACNYCVGPYGQR